MADEVTVLGYLSVTKDGETVSMPELASSREQTVDMSGNTAHKLRQSVGTSAETLTRPDIAMGGWAIFYNSDATNFVEVGDDPGSGFVPFLRVDPGERSGPVRLSANITDLQAKADTGGVVLHYIITDP